MKTVIAWCVGLAVLAGVAWGAGQLYVDRLDQGYDFHARAAEAALTRGDAKAAAGEAVAAMHGRDLPFITFDNSRATALLRDALMAGKAPLIETGTRSFPRFVGMGDVIPINISVGSDGKRLMVLHNEGGEPPIIDIYALPSGRLLRSFPQEDEVDGQIGGKPAGAVVGFSPDLAITIHGRIDGVSFRDTETDRPVLPDFKRPPDFTRWTVSNDRRLVTAHGDTGLRVWHIGASTTITDIPYGPDGYQDDFELAPGGKMAVTGTMSVGNSRSVIELPSQKVKLSWTSNGPIDAVFTQDGRYVVTSVITGETPDHLTWTKATRVWDPVSGQPVGPWLDIGDVYAAWTLSGGRILAIGATDGTRFFDLQTRRLIGTPVNMEGVMEGGATVTDTAAYGIGWKHVLVSYRLNPILAMPAKALTAEACRRWGSCG